MAIVKLSTISVGDHVSYDPETWTNSPGACCFKVISHEGGMTRVAIVDGDGVDLEDPVVTADLPSNTNVDDGL